jgi:hypothetical protein
MKRNFVLVMGALMAGAVTVQAQSSQCSSPLSAARNACNTAIDLFNYMAPQLGSVIAGGNTTLGQGGASGGIGHLSVSVRGNLVMGSLPQVQNYDPTASAGAQTIATKDQVLGLPAVDASVGLFPGINLGVTRVGGVDALLNAYYIPEYSGNGISVKLPDGSVKLGYGLRVGVLEEGLLTPGVGFSFVKRDLPTVDISADLGDGSTIEVRDLSVKTTSWRVTASKSLLVAGLAVGAGQDKYESGGTVQGSLFSGIGTASAKQSLTRTNYFADLMLKPLPFVKLIAEIGSVSGGEVATYNTFSGKAADASRLYGSVGVRLGR